MLDTKTIRLSLSMTQRQFAKALNVNERTVQRWEDGDANPSGAVAEVLEGIRMAIEESRGKAGRRRVKNRVMLGIANTVYRELRRGD